MLTITSASCKRCGSSYSKVRTALYCSDDCRLLAARERSADRRRTDYRHVKIEKMCKDYDEYRDNTAALIKKYGTRIPMASAPSKGKPIPVPHIKFVIYKEPKKVINLTYQWEKQRKDWHER